MNLQQMVEAINLRVDDVVSVNDAVIGLNAGKNLMAIAVGASFPDLSPTDLQGTFVFDAKFHEAPVLYATALFKEQDVALSEVANFMMKFENLKKDFVRFYAVPPRYRDDSLSQQFRATAAQTTFTITKEGYSPIYGDAKVYVNDLVVTLFTVGTITDPNAIVLTNPVILNDYVTVIWEQHVDMIEPPYNWWRW